MIKLITAHVQKKRRIDVSIFKEWAGIEQISKTLNEGTIGTSDSLKFSLNANDHYPEHLHVMRKDQTLARINLNTYEFIKEPKLSKRDQKTCIDWAKEENKNGSLIKQFRDLKEGITVFFYIANPNNIIISDHERILG